MTPIALGFAAVRVDQEVARLDVVLDRLPQATASSVWSPPADVVQISATTSSRQDYARVINPACKTLSSDDEALLMSRIRLAVVDGVRHDVIESDLRPVLQIDEVRRPQYRFARKVLSSRGDAPRLV
jgi:hypothetical protein